jgi:2'-5' RNA ligase
MKNRYNIALIPRNKSDELITLARNFYPLAGKYKIGDCSQPHITLCQFMANESECEAFWKKVSNSIIEHTIILSLIEIDYCTTDSTNWIFLRPNRLEILMKMHCMVANIIDTRIGRCFENFDAHMTLVNTDEKIFEVKVRSQHFEPIQDEFILSLGQTDDVGQYKKVMYL